MDSKIIIGITAVVVVVGAILLISGGDAENELVPQDTTAPGEPTGQPAPSEPMPGEPTGQPAPGEPMPGEPAPADETDDAPMEVEMQMESEGEVETETTP